MNVLWAVKWHRRGDSASADHYLGCAGDKLGVPHAKYTAANALDVLGRLEARADTDQHLLACVRQVID